MTNDTPEARLQAFLAEWESLNHAHLLDGHSKMWGVNKEDLDYNDLKFVVEGFAAKSQVQYIKQMGGMMERWAGTMTRQKSAINRLLLTKKKALDVVNSAKMSAAVRDQLREILK